MASRLPPADLPSVDVAAAAVDARLRGFLRELMAGTFVTKRAALTALEHLDDKRTSVWPLMLATGAAVVVVAVTSGLLLVAPAGDPPPLPIARREPPAPPPSFPPPPSVSPPPTTTIKTPKKMTTPTTTEPLPLPPPSIDDALLRAIERAVAAQREEIEACPDDGSDRVKLHLSLRLGVGSLQALARGDTDPVRCVVDAVAVAAWPKTPHQQVDADVWVWRHPSFKVAAY
jgi:hypothetical protein